MLLKRRIQSAVTKVDYGRFMVTVSSSSSEKRINSASKLTTEKEGNVTKKYNNSASKNTVGGEYEWLKQV